MHIAGAVNQVLVARKSNSCGAAVRPTTSSTAASRSAWTTSALSAAEGNADDHVLHASPDGAGHPVHRMAVAALEPGDRSDRLVRTAHDLARVPANRGHLAFLGGLDHTDRIEPTYAGTYGATLASTMLWTVDPAATAPLHEQIAATIRQAIATGDLAAEEALPPARELATVLGVNANTVLGAYRRLREEGLLDFRRGRGVRVRADAGPSAAVTDAARQLLALGRRYGWSGADLAALLPRLEEGTS